MNTITANQIVEAFASKPCNPVTFDNDKREQSDQYVLCLWRDCHGGVHIKIAAGYRRCESSRSSSRRKSRAHDSARGNPRREMWRTARQSRKLMHRFKHAQSLRSKSNSRKRNGAPRFCVFVSFAKESV